MEKRKIAIFGSGAIGKKAYYMLQEEYEIVKFYDNNEAKVGTQIDGIPIVKWNGTYDGILIVIALLQYEQVVEQLAKCGLRPITDFTLWKNFYPFEELSYFDFYKMEIACGKKIDYQNFLPKRKLAVVFGNCQTSVLEELLSYSPDFRKEYAVVYVPRIFEFVYDKEYATYFANDTKFWKQVDLFIYQKVSKSNRFSELVASDRIMGMLKSSCQKVCILNTYFTGYYPQMCKNVGAHLKSVQNSGLFPYGDTVVESYLQKGFSVEEIIQKIQESVVFPKEKIEEGVRQSFAEMKRREKQADVAISDYILANYKKKQLFYSPNHPCMSVLFEYANRILKYLGFAPLAVDEIDLLTKTDTLKGEDIPLYPDVISYLGLEDYEKFYYPNRYIYNNLRIGFEDWIRMYVKDKQKRDV